MNVQFAVKDDAVYVLEVNPRASRTVPFVSKATGVPLAKVAARVMAGEKLADMGLPAEDRELGRFCVKEAVMPFGRFPGSRQRARPGDEVHRRGHGRGATTSRRRTRKSQLAIDYSLPREGAAFISVCDRDKRAVGAGRAAAARARLQHHVDAGDGAAAAAPRHPGRPRCSRCTRAGRTSSTRIANGEVQLVINTPFGQETRSDGYHIRTAAMQHGVSNITTLAAAQASVAGDRGDHRRQSRRDRAAGLRRGGAA